MALATPLAQPSGRVDPSGCAAPATAETVRDRLTRERLVAAVAHLQGIQVLEFLPDWWDGQSHVPCLVIRGGRRSRQLRVVETGSECVVVPFARRTAQRWLADRRRPRRAEIGIPGQRRPDDPVVVDGAFDTVRCATPSCGVLLPLGFDGDCPVCSDG